MRWLIFVIIERELVQFLEIEELGQCHIERGCDLMQVHDSRIPCPAVDDVVNR